MPLFSNGRQSVPQIFLDKAEVDRKIAELLDFKVIDIRDIKVVKFHLVPLRMEQTRLRNACEQYIKSSRANA
jgi:hypothetical protein